MGQLIQNPSTVPVSVAADWQTLLNVNSAGNVGFNAITMTNWDAGTLAPAIAAGSMIEINGSIAYFQNEEAIGGIQTGLNYLQFVVSGTTVTPSWTLTAPAWNAAKAGWYVGNNRASGHVCYQTGGAYSVKHIIQPHRVPTTVYYDFTYTTDTLGITVIPHRIPNGHLSIRGLSAWALATSGGTNTWYDVSGLRQNTANRDIYITYSQDNIMFTDLDDDLTGKQGKAILWYIFG